MQISVRLGEPYWRKVGQRNLTLELAEGLQLSDLLASLCAQYPALNEEFSEAPPLFFVDDEEGVAETPLEDGNHVHFVWPLAGG